MINIKKEEYFLLIRLSELDLRREYYNKKLARELGVSDSLRDFTNIIKLLKEYNVIYDEHRDAGAIKYLIDNKKLDIVIGNCDITELVDGWSDNKVYNYKAGELEKLKNEI